MADMWPWYGRLVAQIWQTGADRPSVIILRGMWAGITHLVQFCYWVVALGWF